MDRFENISPFTLIEVAVEENCKFIGKKLMKLNFGNKLVRLW